ncbi:HD domain-containing phosphohydrolase [Gorillibacterium sp. sgz5001074]|uniref:HD domain-containing phosphohydrolase n=1 Tax=Gorillibacterium sp. sgz5001074 TaxID=3446695 RepID=UPI003F6714CE
MNGSIGWTAAAIGLAVLLLLSAWAVWLGTRSRRALGRRSDLARELLKELRPELDPAFFYNAVLAKLSGLVRVPSYAFYLYDAREGTYRLRAIRTPDDATAEIGPSYTGLVPYKRGRGYQPAVTMDLKQLEEKPGYLQHLDLKLLAVPLKGGRGLLLAGPVRRVSRSVLRELGFLGELLPGMLDLALGLERDKENGERGGPLTGPTVQGGAAADTKADFPLNATVSAAVPTPAATVVSVPAFDLVQLLEEPIRVAELLLQLIGRHMQAGTALLLRKTGAGEGFSAAFSSGLKKEHMDRLAEEETVRRLLELAAGEKIRTVMADQAGPEEDLPTVIGEMGGGWVMLRIRLGEAEALMLCRSDGLSPESAERPIQGVASLERALRAAGKILGHEALLHAPDPESSDPMARSVRMDLLKHLALFMDLLSPYTVGYSEMISRYSAILAKELGLGSRMIRQVAQAASLAHIGLLGLPGGLMRKAGTYTDEEYGWMKRHAELGAAAVERMGGDKELADMIRCHHERIDGKGYPAGLSGEDIPLGARIIAVSQSFVAMIGGRDYRDPAPFGSAMEQLRAIAGTELDGSIVEALDQWLQQKSRTPAASAGGALGPCWEMNCTPSDICSACPAYGNTVKPCWEQESNCCREHGKSCSTCYVYTETLSRSSLLHSGNGSGSRSL